MSGTVTTKMFVRASTMFDYYVGWDHHPEGGPTVVTRKVTRPLTIVTSKVVRPWTVCSIYRVRKKSRKRDGPHFGKVSACAILHPLDKYDHIAGERYSLRLALLESFTMEDPIGEEHHPLPCNEASLRKPYVLNRDERKEFWDHFNKVRAKMHRKRLWVRPERLRDEKELETSVSAPPSGKMAE